MIDKGDIRSIQWKMSLGVPKSMKKVDGLSLILIDFYISAHASCLNSNETSLQLSENMWSLTYIQVSSAMRPT
jgi:hypothetical protein